jgi:putative secretion ATPase (PEP-CTERM system associated)
MYESYFGLSGNPFRLSPDPAFLFASRGHSKAHAYLRYGVSEGEGFIVVTGEVGAGKTTLTQALIRELDPAQVVAANLVSTQLEADDLLRSVAIAFGLEANDVDKAQLLESVRKFLTGLAQQKRRALLIVDEAQNLTPRAIEELRMLSNFRDDQRPLLQNFLIGQPELRAMMRSPSMEQFRQRVIASCHLGPIDPDETGAYIEHRLRNVGWSGNPSLEPNVGPAVHRATGGIPRRINALCNRLLIGAYLDQRKQIGPRDVAQAVRELSEELSFGSPADRPTPDAAATPAVRPHLISAIAARLDTLDRNVRAVVDLARAISRSESRPRSGGPFRRN